MRTEDRVLLKEEVAKSAAATSLEEALQVVGQVGEKLYKQLHKNLWKIILKNHFTKKRFRTSDQSEWLQIVHTIKTTKETGDPVL
jgi:hypothetical protein